MVVHWISLREARAYVKDTHRHLPRVTGGIVALGCWVDAHLVGVAILGRAARMDGPDTVVITRVSTNGYANACSKLYAKAKRLGQALGFTRIKTFNRPDESGASLRAVGAEEQGLTKAESWGRPSRPRQDDDTTPKRRWSL